MVVAITQLNIASVLVRYKITSVPINPIAFFACLFVSLLMAGRNSFESLRKGRWYILGSGAFAIAYVLLGLLPETPAWILVEGGAYERVQSIIKPVITIVGFPILAMLNTSNQYRFRMLCETMIACTAIGSVVCLIQFRDPTFLADMNSAASYGRGAGLWVNPNNCGLMCTFAILFLPVIVKDNRLLWLGRAFFFVTIFATFSRSAMVGALFSLIVYYSTSKRSHAILLALPLIYLLGLLGSLFAKNLVPEQSYLSNRLDGVISVLLLDSSEIATQMEDRKNLAAIALEIILENAPFFGMGHGSMDRIVPIGRGLGPHNAYLYIWGTSGILALFLFSMVLVKMLSMARSLATGGERELAVSGIASFIFLLYFDHSLIGHQILGPVLSIVIIHIILSDGYGILGPAVHGGPVQQVRPRGPGPSTTLVNE